MREAQRSNQHQHPRIWNPPSQEEEFKMNIDVAIRQDEGIGMGLVCRALNGNVIACATQV